MLILFSGFLVFLFFNSYGNFSAICHTLFGRETRASANLLRRATFEFLKYIAQNPECHPPRTDHETFLTALQEDMIDTDENVLEFAKRMAQPGNPASRSTARLCAILMRRTIVVTTHNRLAADRHNIYFPDGVDIVFVSLFFFLYFIFRKPMLTCDK